MQEAKQYQRCSRGLWDTTVPGITFDEHGVSNYARLFDKLTEAYPLGDVGQHTWDAMVHDMKQRGKNRRYDCVIGVSGGTDSSYLMHMAKELGLRPLAVTFDNGWNSDVSVGNIKKITAALNIDLETYVVDYEEMKDILRAYLRASLPWADFPTDLAIRATMYHTARREGIRYVLIGHDFRSEGTQPNEWTHGDARQLEHIQKEFGTKKLKTYPYYDLMELSYLGYIRGIKMISPFYYLAYQKKKAQELLIRTYGWQYYGGHHHENVYTKFIIAYWLPQKFGIDKRIITLSAQVLSGEITRTQALEMINLPPMDANDIERDKAYVLRKLDITESEFQEIWNRPNRSFRDYPSYLPFIEKTMNLVMPLLKLVLPHKPTAFFQMEMRKDKK